MQVTIENIEQLRRYLNIKTTRLGRVWRQTYRDIITGKYEMTEYISEELEKIFDIDKLTLQELIKNQIIMTCKN